MNDTTENLQIMHFSEIIDFKQKLTNFLNNLEEELKYFSEVKTKDDNRYFPYPIDGFACLDEEKIVAIAVVMIPPITTLQGIHHRIFHPTKMYAHVLVKKEYQRKGIRGRLRRERNPYLIKMGITHVISVVDNSHKVALKILHNDEEVTVFKITDQVTYFMRKLK